MIERTTLQQGIQKPIRSFVERKGRISPIFKALLDELWPKYSLPLTDNKLDFKQIFGRHAPITLEIGFGDGRSLLAQARANPKRDFIGIEVYKSGIAKLLVGMHEHKLSNIRVFCADALEVLTHCIPDNSIEQIQLFFPDPWPKARHHKRRIVQPAFVQLLATKVRENGTLHMATDWEDYATHMLEVMDSQPEWRNSAGSGNYAIRPDSRPLTKFEQRGHRLGYGTWDLVYLRMATLKNI